MTIYDLYLESGPKKKTTMVHVPALLGCIATGPSTEAALAATPDAIRRFRSFLHRHGEPVDPDDPIETRVVEHVTEGAWLGNGSPYLMLDTDLAPLDAAETRTLLNRLAWMSDELAAWTTTQADASLDADPGKGRTAREVVLHVIGAQGAALAYALGSAPGFGKIKSAAERGDLPLAEALDRTMTLVRETIAPLTPEQRNLIRELSSGRYNLRKALRRSLEHLWEHLVELSRRPDGPRLDSLEEALIEGEKSGPGEPFDIERFLAEKHAGPAHCGAYMVSPLAIASGAADTRRARRRPARFARS